MYAIFSPPALITRASSVVSEKVLYFGNGAGTRRRMPGMRHLKPLRLTADERRTLDQWAMRPTSAQRLALRSRIVLACAEGLTNRAVGQGLRVSSNSVCKWRERFRVKRLEGLTDPAAARGATHRHR